MLLYFVISIFLTPVNEKSIFKFCDHLSRLLLRSFWAQWIMTLRLGSNGAHKKLSIPYLYINNRAEVHDEFFSIYYQPFEHGIDWHSCACYLARAFFLFFANVAFARPSEPPTNPILLGASIPLVVFIAAYLRSGTFRDFILAANLRLLTAIRAWRAGGFGFLTLHTYGILPGLFAWPAGLGDIAIIKNGWALDYYRMNGRFSRKI